MARGKHQHDEFNEQRPADGDEPSEFEIGDPVRELEARLSEVEADRDEMESRWKRSMADFQNFQRRAQINEREARAYATADVVRSLLMALDHFDLALGQDPDKTSSEQIIEGVRVIRGEILRALGQHGVALIEPKPNDPFDPSLHEAMMKREAEGVEPGHVVELYQPGYAMGERVVRPAKVAVAPVEGEG